MLPFPSAIAVQNIDIIAPAASKMTEDRQKAEILRQELDAKKAAIREQKQKKQQKKTEDVEM